MKILIILISFLSALLAETARGQTIPVLREADSLYTNKKWAAAKMKYANYLEGDTLNNMVWNRLGYCNQNLGLYPEALNNYNKCLAHNPSMMVKNSATFRIAMVYSLMNKTDEATEWVIRATATGYNSLNDLDSLAAFKNLRAGSHFSETRKKVYEIIYPCSREPRNRDFDFWIGTGNVTGRVHRLFQDIVMWNRYPVDAPSWKIIRLPRHIQEKVSIIMTRFPANGFRTGSGPVVRVTGSVMIMVNSKMATCIFFMKRPVRKEKN
jgi:tetratricopeptide (TPR) repeat protein